MRRILAILLLGGLAALGTYVGFYAACTAPHRALGHSQAPELAWLKHEFKLSEAEFARISELHAAYLPPCAERCRRIDARNAELRELLGQSNVLTAAAEAKLNEAASLRLECQKAMLKHFLDVSRAMPPEQGRRYLSWILDQTLLPEHRMAGGPAH